MKQPHVATPVSGNRPVRRVLLYPFPLSPMENEKRKLSLARLAYEPASRRHRQPEQKALPGPLFDVTVVGLAVAFAIGALWG